MAADRSPLPSAVLAGALVLVGTTTSILYRLARSDPSDLEAESTNPSKSGGIQSGYPFDPAAVVFLSEILKLCIAVALVIRGGETLSQDVTPKSVSFSFFSCFVLLCLVSFDFVYPFLWFADLVFFCCCFPSMKIAAVRALWRPWVDIFLPEQPDILADGNDGAWKGGNDGAN